MAEHECLAERFEDNRTHLRAVAYRMLGSLSEAEDAVQEAWLRLNRADTSGVENLRGWLTTVVARVCLDMLRSRKSRREEPLGARVPEPIPAFARTSRADGIDSEHEALLADSVGLALLVVLDTLAPAERLAFVLHDMFDLPFEDIAPIVGRSPIAARQLASRARRRVQGAATVSDAELTHQREVVDAFLAALRAGDFDELVAVLDPDVVVRVDSAAAAPGPPREIRGAQTWAKGAIAFSRAARFVRPALVNGTVGIILAPRGRLFRALRFTITGGKIVQVDVIADPERLRQLDLAVLDAGRCSAPPSCVRRIDSRVWKLRKRKESKR
jgi:RNA polymerase sigma-70 factor, ECF subfamily